MSFTQEEWTTVRLPIPPHFPTGLLSVRAKGADQAPTAASVCGSEGPSHRARRRSAVSVAEEAATPLAGKQRAVVIGPRAPALEKAAVRAADGGST